MATQDPNSITVKTLGDVAAFFGASEQTIKQWRTGPEPMPGIPGAWPLGEICRWRFAKVVGPKSTDEQRDKLELAKTALQVERLKNQVGREKGELIQRRTAIAAVRTMFNTTRQRLLALPEQLASTLPPAVRSEAIAELKHKMNLVLKEFESWKEGE